MVWIVELDPNAEKELNKLDSQQAKRILKFLFDRVAHLENPRSVGEALKGSRFNTLWKYRVGDYRIVSSIEDNTSRILAVKRDIPLASFLSCPLFRQTGPKKAGPFFWEAITASLRLIIHRFCL